ncbi:MAG: Mandelate racemase/muconate lactonizing enzyme N-terminal domain protein [Candidatus Solibacter sp.]|nr:Mandelate racemase/muconate lactonizing enzyme N-terminal domain protein [Candidatus Solibacter sp.]
MSATRRAFLTAALGGLAGPMLAPVRGYAQEAAARAKPLNLKITGLKTFVVNAGSLNWVFCKIYTNGGLVGLGEGSVTSKEATIAAAIQEHERFLVGKDPTDIELLWQGMYRFPRWRGGPILNSAISAVEIALWDITGQALGVPVYKLLGGAARTRVRMYLDVGSTPEEFLRAKELGYTAAKATPLSPVKNVVSPGAMVREGVKKLQAIRKAVGDDFDIAVDAHGRCTTTMAIDFCTRVEDLDLLFVEEPTQLEDLGELALLREKTRTHLATGERSFTKYGFADFCSRHLVDYIQPDVCHAGGILELKKIGVLAETYRINLAPHNPQSFVSTMASLHVDATTPSAAIQESTLNRTAWIQDLFEGTGPEVKDGYAALPSRPGLGVTLNEKVAAAHPYKPTNRPEYLFGDGSVTDQ